MRRGGRKIERRMEDRYHTETAKMDCVLKEMLQERLRLNSWRDQSEREGSSSALYLSFLRSPIGTGLTEIRGKVEMEPWDWLLANEEVSKLRGDCGGVMRLGLLHSEWEREPAMRGRIQLR